MMMQVWGQVDVFLPIAVVEQRIIAHVMLFDAVDNLNQFKNELGSLLSTFECTSKVISQHTSVLIDVFKTLQENYTELFGGTANVDPKLVESIEHYKHPNPSQVGHLVQSTVGHIDRFKAQEEMQLEYHLRASGMLDAHDQRQAQIYGKKYKPNTARGRQNMLSARASNKEVIR
jgi:uncharacterized membrane-anchored protein YhcB (DUF1043 family)